MSSILRFLVPALRQLSELSSWTRNACLNHQSALRFCSRLISTTGEDENQPTISGQTGDRHTQTYSHGHMEENAKAKHKKDNWRRFKVVRLHRRKLNPEERVQDMLLEERMSKLPEEELFGTLKRRDTLSPSPRVPENHKLTSECHVKSDLRSLDTPDRDRYDKSLLVSRYNTGFDPVRQRFPDRDLHREQGKVVRMGKSDQWTENFGTLRREQEDVWEDAEEGWSGKSHEEKDYVSSDDEDERPFRRLADHGKHSAHWYGRQMKQLSDAGKIKEAIDVLDVWMLRNDRIRPNYYVFSILISILGRAGYTKKAFQVFNQMKKMGIQPKPNTYTALFNACSNSPWPEDGLQRARGLQSLMEEKGHRPNLITYRSMIKAYGVCGDIQTAFRVLDQASLHCQPDSKCFSFLLMACCSDKEAGFRHAILVWRLMRQHHLQPTLYHYNLLLRVIRDCGIGDLKMAAPLIFGAGVRAGELSGNKASGRTVETSRLYSRQSSGDSDDNATQLSPSELSDEMMMTGFNTREDEGTSGVRSENNDNLDSSLVQFSSVPGMPSILEQPLDPASVVSMDLTMLQSAEGRLAVSGGMLGMLSNMAADGVTPDIKTLTQLINSIPPNPQAEQELMRVLEEENVQPDVDFFNMLIRKRNLRWDYHNAKDVLRLIGEYKLFPNMMTFGCLAMGCRRRTDGLQLLHDIELSGLTPNREIFNILVFNSGSHFQYKLDLLKAMEKRHLEPSEKLLMYVEKKVQAAKETIVKHESGRQVDPYFQSDYFHEGYKDFMKFYGLWLKRTPAEKKEHPWAKFRHPKDQPSESRHSSDMEEDKTAFVRNPQQDP